MSNSVVAAAAVSRAKHVAGAKKIKKRAEDQRPTQEEQAAVVHHDESANVVQADAVASHAAMADGSMSGDFSFVSALEGASAASASLGMAQDDSADASGDGPDGSGTLLAIGAVGLAGLGVAVAVSGGGGKKNEAPVTAATQAVATDEGVAKVITVSATDPNGDALTYSASTPANGTVAAGANGSFTYTPKAGFVGTDTFTVTVKDPDGLEAKQTITVTVNEIPDPNAPPVADATKTLETGLEQEVTYNIGATDADGDTLVYSIADADKPEHGTATVDATGKVVYTPADGYSGADEFTVTISDGTDSIKQVVTVDVADAPLVETITIDGLGNTGSDTGAVFVEGAEAGAVVFVDDVTKAQAVAIADFGADDSIRFLNLDSLDDVLFGTGSGADVPGAVADANDLTITYREGEIYNSIILKDALVDNAIVYNYETAVAATGFNADNFVVLG